MSDEILYEFKTTGGENVAQSFKGISQAEKEAAQAAKTLASEQAELKKGAELLFKTNAALTAQRVKEEFAAQAQAAKQLAQDERDASKAADALFKTNAALTNQRVKEEFKAQAAAAKQLAQDEKEAAKAAEALFKTNAALTSQRVKQELKEQAEAAREAARANRELNRTFDEIRRGLERQIGASIFNSIVGLANAAKDAVIDLGRGVIDTGSNLESLRTALDAASGGTAAGTENFKFLNAETDRLSLNLPSAAKNFTQLTAAAKGTSLEGQAVRDILSSVAQAGRTLNLDLVKQEKAYLAITQIVSKGVVQQEELRGQLSEALPGAVQIFARALNVSTAELQDLIKAGKVGLPELQKFSEQLARETAGNVEAASLTFAAATARLETAGARIQTSFFEALKPALTGSVDFAGQIAAEFAKAATESLPELNAQAVAFEEELKNSPETAKAIGEALNEASITLSGELLRAAKDLAGFLNENPAAIGEAVKGMAELSRIAVNAAKAVLDIANAIGRAGKEIEILTAKTSGGTKLGAEAFGSRELLNADQQATFDTEFDKRARVTAGRFGGSKDNRSQLARQIVEEIVAASIKANQAIESIQDQFGKSLLDSGLEIIASEQDVGEKRVAVSKDVVKKKVQTEAEIQAAQLKAIKDGNTQAEEAIKSSVDRQIATTKLKKLSAEEQAVAIAQIEIDAAKKSIAQTELEIVAAKNAGEQKKISATEATALISKLNKELSAETLTLADKEAAADKAKTAAKIKNLTDAFDKQKAANNAQQSANQQETAAIDIQAKALASKRDLQKAISDQVIAGLEAEKTKLEENGASADAIAAKQLQIVAAKRDALLQEQQFQRSSLELDIRRNDLAAQLGILKAQEVKLQADLNLSKLQASNADAGQLAIAQQIVAGAQSQVNGAIAVRDAQAGLNAEARATLAVNQQTAVSQFEQSNAVKATTAATSEQKVATEEVGVAIDENTRKLERQKQAQEVLNQANSAYVSILSDQNKLLSERDAIQAKILEADIKRLSEQRDAAKGKGAPTSLLDVQIAKKQDELEALQQRAEDSAYKALQADKALADAKIKQNLEQARQSLDLARYLGQLFGLEKDAIAQQRKVLQLNNISSLDVPGFADGVSNFGGGLALVGERGPELVKLPRGSDVIPNGRIGGGAPSNRGIESRLDKLIGMSNRPGTLIVSSPNPTSDAADIYQNLDRMSASRAGVGR
jgi:tape measure domain-containing protein